jgi:hypothetical protein
LSLALAAEQLEPVAVTNAIDDRLVEWCGRCARLD